MPIVLNEDTQNIKKVFEEIASKYLDAQEKNKITSELIADISDEAKLSASAVDKLNQSHQEITDYVNLRRVQIETLITQTESKLSTAKYLDLFLSLGYAAYSLGEISLAVELFESVIKYSKKDTKLIDFESAAYFSLGDMYQRQAYWSKSLSNLKKAKNIYSKQKYMVGIAKCENIMGTINGDKGNFVKAKKHFARGLALLNPKKDKYITASIEVNLGNVYIVEEEYDKAITYLYRALSVFEQLSDFKTESITRCNLGTLFKHKNEFDVALKELDSSLIASKKAEYIPIVGIVYLTKAAIYNELKDFPLAIAFSDKAMEISYKINDRISVAEIYKVKGVIQRKLKNYQLAENYLQTSLRLNTNFENELNASDTAYELGFLYFEWNKLDIAKKYLNDSLRYKEKLGAKDQIIEVKMLLEKLTNKK